jgi:hypothetical protein
MRRIPALLALAAAALAACGGPGGDAPLPAGWTRLANGFSFRVKATPGATNVAVVTIVAVGAEHDPVGRSGLAHLTEHLYLTAAAASTPPRTAEACAAARGGRFNGFTHGDVTSVEECVPPDELEATLADVAARLSDLRIEQTDLDRERPRVLEQIADWRGVRDPRARAEREALARVRPPANGGDGWGEPDDVRKTTLEEVRGRARRLYRPVNARLLVVGPVDEAATSALVARLFEKLEPGERAPPPPPPLPVRAGFVELDPTPTDEAARDLRRVVCVAYPAPAETPTDAAASAHFSVGWIRAMKAPGPLPRPLGPRAVAVVSDADVAVDAFLGRVDEEIARFAGAAPTPEEREFAARSLSPASIDAKVAAAAPDQRSTEVARLLVAEAVGGASADDVARAYRSLAQADVERYASTSFVPQKRVVVVAWGPPAPPPRAAATKLTKPIDPGTLPQVRVRVTWDEAAQSARRRMDERDYPKDEDLGAAIGEAHAALVRSLGRDVPVTIDADSRVPWAEVIRVVNLAKAAGIEKIEFAMGAPPKAK